LTKDSGPFPLNNPTKKEAERWIFGQKSTRADWECGTDAHEGHEKPVIAENESVDER